MKKLNSIEVRHPDRAKINKDGILAVARHYTKSLRKPLVISFDNRRSRRFGEHVFADSKHRIRLYVNSFSNADNIGSMYEYLSILLHEIKHAQQQEQKRKDSSIGSQDEELNYWYSDIEIEARLYQERHIRNAIKIYQYECSKNSCPDRD